MAERVYTDMKLILPDRQLWTLPAILSLRARTHADRIFLDVPDHGRSYTFRAMLDVSQSVAGGLVAAGGQLGDRLLIMAPNSADVIIGWFGANLAGLIEVPINTAYRGSFLEHQVRTTAPRFALIDAAHAERFLEGNLGAYATIEHFYLLGGQADQERALASLRSAGHAADSFAILLASSPAAALPEVTRYDTAAIFFTSGTTGLSKGVSMSHSQLSFVAQQLICLVQLTDQDTQMSVGPLFHGNAQFLATFPCLIAGARIVLREKFSASRWIDQIRDCRATVTNFIGVMMDWVFKQPERETDADNDLRCVYTVPTPWPIVPEFSRRFGVDVYVEQYGMTEISMPILCPYGQERPVGTAGLLVSEYFDAKIVDPETDEELPVGEVGEFVVRAKENWIMLTDYYNMPDRTAEAQRNLWFHTGDGLRKDADGWYYFVDRLKDAIRRRGENISSYEVEQVLLSNPRITDCAAVAAPAASHAGEDEVALFVVVDPANPLSYEELRAWCDQALPSFARPQYLAIVDELPKTPSGKIRKTILRDRANEMAAAWAAAPGAAATTSKSLACPA